MTEGKQLLQIMRVLANYCSSIVNNLCPLSGLVCVPFRSQQLFCFLNINVLFEITSSMGYKVIIQSVFYRDCCGFDLKRPGIDRPTFRG